MGLADFMRPKYPLDRITIDDLIAALKVLAASPDVGEVPILQIEARHDGHLLVHTGFQHGIRAGSGKDVLLRRSGSSWSIVEIGRWKS